MSFKEILKEFAPDTGFGWYAAPEERMAQAIAGYRVQIANLQAERARLGDDLTRALDLNARLREDGHGDQSRIIDLRTQLADLRAERDRWKDEYQDVCKFATDYEGQRDDLRAQLAKSEAARKELRELLKDLRQEFWDSREKMNGFPLLWMKIDRGLAADAKEGAS